MKRLLTVLVFVGLTVVAWLLWPADVEPPRPASAPVATEAHAPDEPKPRVERHRDVVAPSAPVVSEVKSDAAAPDEMAEPKFDFEVTVLRSDGTPAPGASILLLDPNDDGNAAASATADAKGIAAMRVDDGLVRVVAWLGAEANATAELVPLAERQAVTVRLGPAVVVRGRVIERGKPVSGAAVSVTAEPWFKSEFGLALTTTTGSDGRFEVPPIADAGIDPLNPPEVHARTSDLATGHAVGDLAALRRGEDVVVELHSGFSVRARFVDPEGKPIGGVVVRAASQNYAASSDADGRLLLRLPSGASMQLGALRETREIVDSELDFENSVVEHWHIAKPLRKFDGAAGDIDLGDVVLPRGLPLKGIVVDSAGQPARRARVSLSQDGVSVGDVRTGDDGRFVFTEVGPEAHRVSARERAVVAREKVVDGVKGGDPELRIVLDDVLAVTLRFLSADDRKPLACSQYSIRAKLHGEGFDWYGTQVAGDPAGSYVFDVLSAGSYDLEVDVPGYEPQRFESVEILAGRPAALDLLLRKKTN